MMLLLLQLTLTLTLLLISRPYTATALLLPPTSLRRTHSTTTTTTTPTTAKAASSAPQQLHWTSNNNNNNNNNNLFLSELVSSDSTLAWNSLVGEADRAFRLGIQLEKNGQARKASAAFHEAATMYQCFAERPTEFGHVTCLGGGSSSSSSSSSDDVDENNNNDNFCNPAVTIILAYTCLRLGVLNLDALGDAKAAVRLCKEACIIDPFPSAVSFDQLGQCIEAAADTATTTTGSGGSNKKGYLEDAVTAYRQAIELHPSSSSSSSSSMNRNALFHLAVALERLGQTEEAEEYFDILRREESVYACLVDSWGYVRWHTRKVQDLNLYRGTRSMLEIALKAAMPLIEQGGLVCEFGVGSGRSLRMTQEILPLNTGLHGFDTFTGLPQSWGNEPKGAYSTGGRVPSLEGPAYFHKGLFKDTIGPFLEQAGPDAFLAYANVDCDLYSSTLDVLESMHGRVRPGTILVFDEYICHPTWRQDEFRAWRESCKRFGWKYQYLAFSLSTKQAVVRVTDA